jgi:hypothetical protein
MRFVRSESIEIAASREQVFALVTRLAEADPTHVRLVTSASPHRCVHECNEAHASYRWTFDLTTSPTGTTVHQTVERLRASGLSSMLQPFKWELSQCGQVRSVLQRLKSDAERPGIPQPRQGADQRSSHPVS